MTITLNAIKAAQGELAAMIAAFEAQAAEATSCITLPEATITLAPGERYAGLILDDGGQPAHHLILLPGEAEEIDWEDAIAWAVGQGGELPSRREQAVLYANLKGEFKSAWYWSAEEYARGASCAWFQSFGYGSQDYHLKIAALRARAVRRLVIE